MRLTLENHFETVKSDIRPSRPTEFNAGTLAAAGKTRKWRLRESAYDGGHPMSIWNGVEWGDYSVDSEIEKARFWEVELRRRVLNGLSWDVCASRDSS